MGYLRFPTISGDTIVFTAEDDLWSVSVQGGRAHRLTAGVAEASGPVLSPDGELVAFVGCDEGPREVYVMPVAGGEARRLTFDGSPRCEIAGWSPDGRSVIYASAQGQPFLRDQRLRQVALEGGLPETLPYGLASALSYGPDGGVVLGRRSADPARWKRYRGGTAGDVWIDAIGTAGTGEFRPLIRLAGNLARPCWVGERIYFLADHEGIANVYSCTPDGHDLRRHTDHADFYARNLRTDGSRLVYHCGGALWLLDPSDAADEARQVPVTLGSTRTQRSRQFVSASEHLETATLGPDGSDLAITTRGKAFTMAHWEGPVAQHGEPDGVRYRLLRWLPDHQRLVATASDEGPDERLVVLTADASAPPQPLDLDIGHPHELVVSPTADQVALVNQRGELLLVDLAASAPSVRRLDDSEHGRLEGLAWSPDGRWLAYARPYTLPASMDHPQRTGLVLCRVETGETWPVTDPLLRDWAPAFDPDGRYLYFLGKRDFQPLDDEMHFSLGYPLGSRPYALTLRADVPSPFVPVARPVVSEPAAAKDGGSAATPTGQVPAGQVPPVEIDVDGIADRVVAFPVPEGRYRQVAGLRGKVLFSSVPVGADTLVELAESPAVGPLEVYDFEKQKSEQLLDRVEWFALDGKGRTLLCFDGKRLRVLPAGEKPSEDKGDDPTRGTGWIDLDRVKVSVRPGAEWRQMFREAWRLQQQHFWDAAMSGVDWEASYARYLPLVDQVATRGELSDLLWELQGELGTSHAYEFGGAYRPGPQYRQGFLGVDWTYDEGQFRIERIVRGDPWRVDASSPLGRPGVDVAAGDAVLAVNSVPVGAVESGIRLPGEPLVNQAGQEVRLTVARASGKAAVPRTVTVRAAESEDAARYRDWVEANRAYVHEQTGGRVGYVHIPDMAHRGLGEFHRGFLAEYDREGLVVDARFNGGGYVSQLVMDKLAQRRLGYDHPRHGQIEPYPYESPRGPMVALCNAESGSDGDIFSHTFKMRGLGPLIGTRTWGGVIGYTGRTRLADGTTTTQPEFSFAFDDVGWQVENYGTDPDVEVDIAPQDYAKGVDPQLDKGIELVLAEIAAHPPHTPGLLARPRLTPPPLPPRA